MTSHPIFHTSRRWTALLVLLLQLLVFPAVAQEVIRVTGKVVSKEKQLPLFGVNVTDVPSGRSIATTDEDGRFAVDVRSNTTLRFSMIGAKSTSQKVKGHTELEVQLEEEDVFLGEAVVAAKRITDKVTPEPTDIEIHGNYLTVRTRVRVPREMFGRGTRLVTQPLISIPSRDTVVFMRPLVYDGQDYNRTQDRLYNFRMKEPQGDPLANYVTVKSGLTREAGRKNDIIGYSDSIYIENIDPNADYRCDVPMAIEDYHHILYRDTTTIAHGSVNPMRWLDYSFASSVMRDPSFFPRPEVQLRDSRGEVNLRFPVGKAQFDVNDPQNAAEVENMRDQIEQIGQTQDATLQSLTMHGTSSPEGRYEHNLALAQKRLDFALNYLREQVPENMRRGMKFQAKAQVAPWSEVSRLMRADGLNDEADRVDEVIHRYKSTDSQSTAMRRLGCYDLIAQKYLPQLRRVDYVMNYSIFRQLTLDEIQALYEKDYRQLSRFEFFQLYRAEEDSTAREKMLRQTLEIYPSFMTAANDLQALLINRHASEPDLLKPFAGERAPLVVNANHMIALLANGRYAQADSISSYVADTDDTHLLLAVNGALNGRYADNYNTVASTGLRNELVMLLAMKRNEEALEMSRLLPDNEALSHYLRATCLNRMEKPIEAYDELKTAFKMDPSLEKTALIDGDVNDLLLDEKGHNN